MLGCSDWNGNCNISGISSAIAAENTPLTGDSWFTLPLEVMPVAIADKKNTVVHAHPVDN